MNQIPKPTLIILFLFLFNPIPTSLLLVSAAIIETLCLDSVCQTKEPIIRFPFHIEGKQAETCGYPVPGFTVSCSDEQEGQSQTLLKLPTNSGGGGGGEGEFFSIKRINYATQQIWLNDPNNCLPKRILSLNLSGSPFDAVYYQYFTFFNCSSNLEYLSYRYKHIACLSEDNNYNIFATSSSSVVKHLSSLCDLVDTVKVAVRSSFDDHPLSSELTDDLRLSWEMPPCGRCESHGGHCGLNFNIITNSNFEISCSSFSSTGVGEDYFSKFQSTSAKLGAKQCGISKEALYIITICIGVPALLCIIAILSCIWSRFKLGIHGWTWSHHDTVADFEPLIGPRPNSSILGLDKPTIDSYPKTVLDENQLLPKPEDETCPICLSDYRPKETVKHIPECNHCFHAQCIDEWLPLNASCPICRTSPRVLPQQLDPSLP